MEKRLLVLANSIKHSPHRCIAGREILRIGGDMALGHWIRPISSHGEGELTQQETALTGGGQPAVMGCVKVPVLQKADDPAQPEDWLIDARERWTPSDLQIRPSLDELVEDPPDLWSEPGQRTDRISENCLSDHPPPQSLYVIEPQSLRLAFFTNEFGRGRRRARFTYRGRKYDLSLTDPGASNKYCPRVPGQDENELVVDEFESPVLICVSLASAWKGYHYKLVASVLERQ